MVHLIFLALLISPILFGCSGSLQRTLHGEVRNASGAEDGTYLIENEWVRLVEGRGEREIFPGAASKTVTTLFAEPAYGDLDGDGKTDAALLLVQQGGGSGSFFYVSAALNSGGSYRGTNAVLLGDRIAPQNIEIRNSRIIVLYNDRRIDEPMVATPSVGKTKRLRMENGRLAEIAPGRGNDRLEQGWVTIGHEVRAFLPCGEGAQRWLLGDSPALPEIMAAHRQAFSAAPPYGPLFMVLAGVSAPRPEEGFGNDYGGAFRAEQLVEADPRGHCRSELLVVESPAPGERIVAPLKVTGKARGSWFFEGDFPLLLTDSAGRVLARGFATAQGPWMTEEWVPFSGGLDLRKVQAKGWGWLVLRKDNPSDRRELDDEVAIPLQFE